MKNKSTTPTAIRQQITICKDLPENTIEFFGIRKNMTTMFFQDGIAKKWCEMPKSLFTLMANAYQQDKGAKDYLSTWNIPYTRQVELFAYFNWGTLDHQPDILNGILQPCENFRHSPNCPSRTFDTKHWTINREELTQRDVIIIDLIAKNFQDWQIANVLNIAESTYNAHKGKLFKRTKTFSRVGLLVAAFREKLISC